MNKKTENRIATLLMALTSMSFLMMFLRLIGIVEIGWFWIFGLLIAPLLLTIAGFLIYFIWLLIKEFVIKPIIKWLLK